MSLNTTNWRKITTVQKAEFLKREFLCDDFWIKNKQSLDEV